MSIVIIPRWIDRAGRKRKKSLKKKEKEERETRPRQNRIFDEGFRRRLSAPSNLLITSYCVLKEFPILGEDKTANFVRKLIRVYLI